MHPNPGRQVQELVTASDTTTTLAMPMKRKFRLSGSGVLQWYDLGDARKYPVGLELEFFNASSEIVGVLNSGSSVWERIPPRWGIKCILRDKSTAAGVWDVEWRPNPMAKNGGLKISDFGGTMSGSPYNYYSEDGWTGVVSNGVNALNPALDPSGSAGVICLAVGAVASYALLWNYRYAGIGGGPRRYKYRVSKSNANAAANETTMRVGLSDNIAGGAATNGIQFINDFTTYGNFWVTRTIAAAGGNTTNVSASVPVLYPNYENLSFEVNAAGTRVDFFIGNVFLFTHAVAANIPLGISIANQFSATKVLNTSTRYLYVDYVEQGFYPTTQR